jgi:signal transduction histidine kinase
MKKTRDFLKNSDFFSILNDDELAKIAPFFKSATYASGEMILSEDGAADRLFLVESGTVEIWKNYGDSAAARLAEQSAGSLFGEMALIDDEPRSASVVASSQCSVLYLSKDDFYRLAEEYPSIMFAVLRALSRMIRTSNDSYVESLNNQNRELQQALIDLKTAQKELIRTERFSNLGKLSSLIIHDLRNPLSVIKGYGEMLQVLYDEPEQVREYSKKIVQEAIRLNQFAQELLDYSRGDLRLNWVFTSFPMIFQKLGQYVQKTFERSGIEVQISHEGIRPFYVDEERLMRAILNLCDNARKAMGDGGTLQLTGRQADGQLIITVKDNGTGMSEDVLAHIFEPFYSFSQKGGTGLGMVSVKTIVEAHGGSIRIDSAIDKGTTVTLELPHNEVLPD